MSYFRSGAAASRRFEAGFLAGVARMSRPVMPGAALCVALCAGVVFAVPAAAQTIIDEWAAVKLPAPPELKRVDIDPATTALLLFDFTHQTCTTERRPRCAASVPKLKSLHDQARRKGMFIVYSVAGGDAKPADILPEIAPHAGDPVLPPLGPDKFVKSDFEKMLRDKGITTIILTGTAAQTTVLHTGASAALRGFKVVVPVDAMSSNDAFPEAYTAWHLATSARIMNATVLTRADMISF